MASATSVVENHFLNALSAYSDKQLYFLIHTGSRSESAISMA